VLNSVDHLSFNESHCLSVGDVHSMASNALNRKR
jgi:hypothetical protein